MTLSYSERKTLAPENQFSFNCPVFAVDTKIAGCFVLRDMVWRGEQVATRKGCQVAMHACKCPINQIIKNMGRQNDDPYHSVTPVVGKLREDVLEHIAAVRILEKDIEKAALPPAETAALNRCNERTHDYACGLPSKKMSRRDPPKKRLKVESSEPESAPEIPDMVAHKPAASSPTIDAATTGDMSAAVNAEIKEQGRDCMISETIVRKDAAGGIRTWSYEANLALASYRTISGVRGGSMVTSRWTACVGKQGRNNAEQALFEAEAMFEQKLDREYRRTEAELDSVPTSPMLAKNYKDLKDSVANVFKSGGVVFSQPKLDGIRAKITREGAFSREFQRHLNVDHILAALKPLFDRNPSLELDGELYNHDLRDNFNKIASIVRKQKPGDAQRAEAAAVIQYHVYDVPSDGNSPFQFRAAHLNGLLAQYDEEVEKTSPIRFVATNDAHSFEELDAHYGAYLEQGYEGQMVRIDAPYEADKRSKFLLKRKEFLTAEFPISRVIEGQGNWAGYAKAVEFILPDDKRLENGERPKAGIKGDQAQAKRLLETEWGSDAVVTVRYFTPTPLGIPRFPVAVDFHPEGRSD